MKPIARGKTKEIIPHTVVLKAYDRVTWDNEEEADMPGKAVWSTTTTANVFRLFEKNGEDTAFVKQIAPDEILCEACDMIPIEVVGRTVIDPVGSYHDLYPDEPVDALLPKPVCQFFLKTTKCVYGGTVAVAVPFDDPRIVRADTRAGQPGFWLAHPRRHSEEFFVETGDFGYEPGLEALLEELARRMRHETDVLYHAWAHSGWQLRDWKGEYGFTRSRNLVLADVIDNDSWRVRDENGIEHSKQVIRDAWRDVKRLGLSGDALNAARMKVVEDATPHYVHVADMSAYLLAA